MHDSCLLSDGGDGECSLAECLQRGMLPQPSLDGYGRMLQRCKAERGLLSLQIHMRRRGVVAHRSLGGLVVSVLMDMDLMLNAMSLFDALPHKNEHSWNSFISGLARCGHPLHALAWYHQMQRNGSINPDAPTFSALLKACGKLKDLRTGSAIHEHISRVEKVRKDVFVVNSLVDMYAKCRSVATARRIFDEIPVHDVVSWTTMIGGYSENSHEGEALICFERMRKEGILPNAITFVSVLKACGNLGCPHELLEIEAEIEKQGLLREHLVVGNSLIDSFSKCGWLKKAHEVIDKIPYRNVVSWTSLLGGYVEHGYAEQALICFRHMKMEGIALDAASSVCILKACGNLGSITEGEEVHAEIDRFGLSETNALVGSALIDMYAKCGLLAKAQCASDRLRVRNAVSWNALMDGYAAHGQIEAVLKCVRDMKLEGIDPDDATYACMLKACGSSRTSTATIVGEIRAEIERRGFPEGNPRLANALINAYARHGFLSQAEEILSKLPVRDVFSWTSLMTGYVELGHAEAALDCFRRMQAECISPDAASFVCSLKACAALRAFGIGKELHQRIEVCGASVSEDVAIGNGLIRMYAGCGMVEKAKEAFDRSASRSTVAWNALIAGYIKNGGHEEALECYDRMQVEGTATPDSITFVSMLKACEDSGAVDKAADIQRRGIGSQELLEAAGKALVKIYARCGLVAEAQQAFEKLREEGKDIVSRTALLAGYDKHGRSEQALGCLEQIRSAGMRPTRITYVCALKACRNAGAASKGEELHSEIERRGLMGEEMVGNAVLDMYASCGLVAKAREVFDGLPERDVVTWTSLMSGHVRLGRCEAALDLFDAMLCGSGVKPDAAAFVVVLAACARMGLVDRCERCFEGIDGAHGIAWNCIANLLARVGRLEDSVGILRNLPLAPDANAWRCMLAASRRCGHMGLGIEAFRGSIIMD